MTTEAHISTVKELDLKHNILFEKSINLEDIQSDGYNDVLKIKVIESHINGFIYRRLLMLSEEANNNQKVTALLPYIAVSGQITNKHAIEIVDEIIKTLEKAKDYL